MYLYCSAACFLMNRFLSTAFKRFCADASIRLVTEGIICLNITIPSNIIRGANTIWTSSATPYVPSTRFTNSAIASVCAVGRKALTKAASKRYPA